jgi:hypothetical protein
MPLEGHLVAAGASWQQELDSREEDDSGVVVGATWMSMLAGADKFFVAGGHAGAIVCNDEGGDTGLFIGNECLGVYFSAWLVCSKLGRTAMRKGSQGPHRCQAAVT